jgi:hypothetical protein
MYTDPTDTWSKRFNSKLFVYKVNTVHYHDKRIQVPLMYNAWE